MRALKLSVIAMMITFGVTSCVSLSTGWKDGKGYLKLGVDSDEVIDWGKEKWQNYRNSDEEIQDESRTEDKEIYKEVY